MNDLAVHFSSVRQDWATPPEFFAGWRDRFDLNLDVCASPDNAKLPRFFTVDDDALIQDWAPHRCWMNPPYGRQIGKWVKKAYVESLRGARVVCLLPSRTDTAWWHDYCQPQIEKGLVHFIRGRVTFVGALSPAPFPSVIVIF